MLDRQTCDQIMGVIGPVVAPLGYECVEVEWDGAEETLRVFIDQPEGIRMEDCLRVNEALIENSELDALVGREYRLEISSPGLDRPLRRKEHFIQQIGRPIHVVLQAKCENRREGSGKLLGIDAGDVVSLELPAGVWAFPFQAIRKANLVYEW
jgi:ribosome maturation factor RimP